MIISLLRNQRFTLIVITLFMTLQISACGNKDNLAAATSNINPDQSTNTGTDTDTGINSTVADARLSWAAPAEREDNSSIFLSEIAGYQLFYGKVQGHYTSSITINDGTATGYILASLPTGTYYFVMTTLDTEGRESQFSPEIVITV